MVSESHATCDLPLLEKVRVVGRHCLRGEMPHVLLAIDTMLDDFSAGKKAHEVYKCTGSLRLMQYVAAREPFEEMDPFYRRSQFNRTMEIAAAAGDLKAVKWLVESYKPQQYLTKTVAAAAANGHLHLLQWLFENHYEIGYWGCTEMCGALLNNHSEVVEWLRQHATPHKDSLKKVMEAAAAAGNVKVVEWLFNECHAMVLFLESHRTEGCVLHRNSIIRLPLELMQWLIAKYAANLNGCEFEVERCDWRFNEWCREINLRMAHQNEESVWWECHPKTIQLDAP
ncbi:hypothetical protein PF005_g11805 [Phytophthora fragariae]|uniref:Ankyrin repeat-containing domain n=1 Tax=Phytophthora fragariae TaxID=53985 RepID=A0A6A3KBV3_9STRA|nr:hypothetical protein PF003_g22540 [Phytophthora fragariae]KAE8943621.1 hypothetical protein PF009_g6664 [Phytophthora fragariae]KAE9001524.1 hypothetical protein PF011_g13704 [Phytophthora fragariae]KAE9147885.1 hypothetical protein PF006_g7482 [Phytophthora fragariae]KAE9209507.1 hypothetical protein PF005_g11805 [Phytophthora fragariae]